MDRLKQLSLAYRLRWKRRRLLFRSFRKRRQLRPVIDRTAQIGPDDILVFSTMRNEMVRLPHFLAHHRALGVDHFLIVENDSDDGTRDYLARQPDVSLWTTPASYKLSRFGVDWLTWLQHRHAHGHWCLTVDADEILIYPHHDTRPLRALTEWLDRHDRRSFGALMLDMYPKGPLNAQVYEAGDDPFDILAWFDGGNYMIQKKPDLENLWIQGGVRARVFFADRPRRAPTMSKTPLVKWHRGYAYVSSSHSILPRKLNHVYDEAGGERTSGILLHTKFLHTIVERSAEEKHRAEHFANSDLYDTYYDSLTRNPDLWCEKSTRLISWRQLEAMGLMSKGNWI
ncbi:glycosyltransferase family 2 protein [Roseovarius faecimaris]|uniref:Glycosyltransferase family 2 protein n=1 Tax=Roseovarius faecimaris TaxID=2494550 RepID=A0A6I6IVH7_9RHOB|nr:glycosyltransferase family 2 protein [Roseovarius faecimaris]QGY00085.1 glycosyltransferase family 2 protein [Roseovarius faecimaris]